MPETGRDGGQQAGQQGAAFGPAPASISLPKGGGAVRGVGFGWNLSLPSITRKTDKGLPQYRDAGESDVYALSGAEDLVPVLRPDGTRFVDDTTAPGYLVHRYRPRVEGLFARIERWTEVATGEIHWRSISADNVDRTMACERNRLRTANRYVKRIRYGNRESRLVQPDLSRASWLFEVVFDYDEGHYEQVDPDPARPAAEQHRCARASAVPARPWAVRRDPFSSHRAGFEVRSYRRCRRVLMFHHIPDLPTGEDGYDGLVRCTEFDYADLDYGRPVSVSDELTHQGSTRFASFLRRITQSGYVRDDSQPAVERDGVTYATYRQQSLPPLEFDYSKPVVQDEVRNVEADHPEAAGWSRPGAGRRGRWGPGGHVANHRGEQRPELAHSPVVAVVVGRGEHRGQMPAGVTQPVPLGGTVQQYIGCGQQGVQIGVHAGLPARRLGKRRRSWTPCPVSASRHTDKINKPSGR